MFEGERIIGRCDGLPHCSALAAHVLRDDVCPPLAGCGRAPSVKPSSGFVVPQGVDDG